MSCSSKIDEVVEPTAQIMSPVATESTQKSLFEAPIPEPEAIEQELKESPLKQDKIVPETQNESISTITDTKTPSHTKNIFSTGTILDLLSIVDPSNTKVSDGVARGAAWMFIREIADQLTKGE